MRQGFPPDAVRLAVGTLTALPVPPPRDLGRRTAARAMLLAPLVGLVPGGAAALVALAATGAGLAALPAAALAVGTLALTTRGLHLDGLADTADGLAASYDRERALAVMRRGDTGPAGLASVVLVLLVQVSALAQALSAGGSTGAVAVVAAAVAGRVALPLACRRGMPAARPDGLGALVAGTVHPAAAVGVATAVTAAVATATAVLIGGGVSGDPGAVLAVLAVPAACLAAELLLRRCRGRLGGTTGDVLGAAVETATTAALVVLAVAVG